MERNYSSAFRVSDGFGPINSTPILNVDLLNAARMIGATQIDQMPLQPPTLSAWSILGVSISGSIYCDLGTSVAGATVNVSGSLLPIYAGFCQLPQTPLPTVGQAVLPVDQSTIGTLWDPASDALPPSNGTNVMAAGVTANPVQMFITFPQPIKTTPGMICSVGIWMPGGPISMTAPVPATAQFNVGLLNMTYQVNYDDGT